MISIVIVCYKSENVILNCLLSIKEKAKKTKIAIEVIIVDNYIDSKLNLFISSNFFDEGVITLKYISNISNGGFGCGNNIGVRNSSGDVVLFLNPDTIIIDDIFDETYFTLVSNKSNVVSYSLVDLNMNYTFSYGIYPEYYILNYIFNILVKCYFYIPNKVKLINRLIWPWGAAFAMLKMNFEKAGMFDEKIFLCNEEPDLMKRIIEKKIRVLKGRIVHLEGHSTEIPEARYEEYLKSTKYYFEKYNSSYNLFVRYLRLVFYLKSFMGLRKSNKNILCNLVKNES